MVEKFLASLKPDNSRLFFAICKHISDEMLREIALADYGQDHDLYFAALKLLRDSKTLQEPMHRYPCEVLELVRHSEPQGDNTERGNWIRAFACAALFYASGEPWRYQGDAEPSLTLIQLINSISVLPIDLGAETISLVSSLMLSTDLEGMNSDAVYFGVGLLWLLLRDATAQRDGELIELSEWIVRREEEIHKRLRGAFDRWLLGIGDDPPPSPWEQLGRRMTELELEDHQEELREWVRLIGSNLAGDQAS